MKGRRSSGAEPSPGEGPEEGQRPRVFIRPEAVRGDRVRFEADEARHLGRVPRLRPGDVVEATDGAGHLYTVRLAALDGAGAWGTIEARAEPGRESPCAITLAQAILKGDRMAWLVQKATELGRGAHRPDGDRARGRARRARRERRTGGGSGSRGKR